jgi:hypothetical protein
MAVGPGLPKARQEPAPRWEGVCGWKHPAQSLEVPGAGMSVDLRTPGTCRCGRWALCRLRVAQARESTTRGPPGACRCD